MAQSAPRPAQRSKRLTELRQRKMARSAHAYVRGNTARFYEWLESANGDTIPAGPSIWICGDCHVGNLGPVVDSDSRVGVQIRDLDQAVIGNPAHDLIRLGLSLASACRSANLPGAVSVAVVDELIEAYAGAFRNRPPRVAAPDIIRNVLKEAVGRTWKQMIREHLDHSAARLPLGKRFWPLRKTERRVLDELFAAKETQALAVRLGIAAAGERIAMADAAYWVKGCSSLGRPRYVVLLEIRRPKGKPRLAMLDIKDAPPAAAPRSDDANMPKDNAERVTAAAHALSPALGERMVPLRLLGQSMVLRELAPADLKIEPDRLPPHAIDDIARYLGRVLGDAHARQMSADDRRHWLRTLRSSRSKVVDAPSWLWRAIVNALASHEHGYLEHCRRHIAILRD